MADDFEHLTEQIKGIANDNERVSTSFRQAANDNNQSMANFAKDLNSYFSKQKNDIQNLSDAIESNIVETENVARKIDNTNQLLQNSINIQRQMLGELTDVSGTLNDLLTEEKNKGAGEGNTGGGIASLASEALGELKNVGKGISSILSRIALPVAAGALTHFLDKDESKAGNSTIGSFINENIPGAARIDDFAFRLTGGLVGTSMQDPRYSWNQHNITGPGGADSSKNNVTYSASEEKAKESAEKYYGKPIDSKEWSELVRATYAESGHKNQTEMAMVMASVLNRARSQNKSIHEVLYAPNQFQAVTGTNTNFLNGPDQKTADKIFGASANILENVSKQQKNFTAASGSAYRTPGYQNTGYRDKMLAEGGSVVGGSVFNTQPPSVSNETAPSNPSGGQANRSVPATQAYQTSSQSPVSIGTGGGEDAKKFLQSRQGGGRGFAGVNADKLNSSFAEKMMKAISAAEAATGDRIVVTEGYRDSTIQAQYYANYKQTPIEWQGKTYYPQKKGGIAAKPGNSKHQRGLAVDISRGRAHSWLTQNASRFGIKWGGAFGDPPHFEDTSGGGNEYQDDRTNNQPVSGAPSAQQIPQNYGSNQQFPGGYESAGMLQPMRPANPLAVMGGMIGGAFGGGKGAAIGAGIGGIASLIGGMLSAPAPGPIPEQKPNNPQTSTPQNMAVAPLADPHLQASRNKEGIHEHDSRTSFPHQAYVSALAPSLALHTTYIG